MPLPSPQRWTIATRPLFESSHELGIPDLLPQRISLPRRLAILAEESGPGSLVMDRTLRPLPGSTIGFYVDDYRFESLWTNPQRARQRLQGFRPAALIEPDFSIYSDHPFAVAVWNLYRSRWTARYWQQQGLRVIPSLCWNTHTLDHIGAGISRGSVVACEGRPRFKDPGLFLEGLLRGIQAVNPSAVLLYGCPQDLVARLPTGPEYVCLPSWSPKRRLAQSRAA